MKRKINIIVISLIFAISSSIGLGRVKGEGGGVGSYQYKDGEYIVTTEGDCDGYAFCYTDSGKPTYIVIEVYDVKKKTYTYYYDFFGRKDYYKYANFIRMNQGYYIIDANEVFGTKIPQLSTLGGREIDAAWYKAFDENTGLFSQFTLDGTTINKTPFTRWLYYERAGAPYSKYQDVDTALAEATKDLKSSSERKLFEVRISGGLLYWVNNGPYRAVDRFADYRYNLQNHFGNQYKVGSGMNLEHKSLKPYSDSNAKNMTNELIGIRYTQNGEKVFGDCYEGDLTVYCYNTMSYIAYFSDYGYIEHEDIDPCETLCKKSENKNFWENAELPNGMTTEEACVSCCDSNTGQINLDLNSCKYKPNECSYTPPSPSANPNNSDLSCTSINNLDFKVQVGNYDDGCSKIPIYNSFSGVINVSDKRTFYDGTLAKLLVAGKGFNWDLSFQGSINYQQSIPKQEYLDSYNTYIQCLKLKVNANVATDNERAALDTYTQCYNNLSSYNPTTLQSGNIDVSSIFDISTKQMNINAYGSQPARTQIANQYDAIYKNSGDPFNTHTIVTNKDFVYTNTEFFIPITVQNGTKGKLIAQVNSQILQMTDKQIECPIVISSYVECQDDDNCLDDDDDCDDPNDPNCHFFQCDDPNGCTTGLNLIYRPISLKEPFPNRTAGYNWQGMYNNNKYEELFITNSRGASDNEIYQEEPMYVITLTPTDIKEIREYNKSHSYNDFNLTCDEYGLYCKSEFIKDYSNLFKSGTCGLVGDWYACYTQNQKVAVEEILAPMKW